MNFRAKHWPEGVFVREGGGGGGGGLIICSPTCTGSWCNTKKKLVLHFCDFSVSNDIHVFLSINYIHVYIN